MVTAMAADADPARDAVSMATPTAPGTIHLAMGILLQARLSRVAKRRKQEGRPFTDRIPPHQHTFVGGSTHSRRGAAGDWFPLSRGHRNRATKGDSSA